MIDNITLNNGRIFCRWRGQGCDPRTDLTWLCFAYDPRTHDYAGRPNYFDYQHVAEPTASIARGLSAIVQSYVCGIAGTLPRGAQALATVFTKLLAMILDDKFPVGPILAHHFMVQGSFMSKDGTPFPCYANDAARSRPAMDAVEGIRVLLDGLGVRLTKEPVIRQDVLNTSSVSMADQNFAIVNQACAQFIKEPQEIDDILMFWQHNGLMNRWVIVEESFTHIDVTELLFDPVLGKAADTSFWVDVHKEWFFVFNKCVNNVSGLHTVDAWLIVGRVDNHVFRVEAKTRLCYGQASRQWAMRLPDDKLWHVRGGLTTGGAGDRRGQRGSTRYKLSVSAVESDGDLRRSATTGRATQLALCTRVPASVTFAMSLDGPLMLDTSTQTLVSALSTDAIMGKGIGKGIGCGREAAAWNQSWRQHEEFTAQFDQEDFAEGHDGVFQ